MTLDQPWKIAALIGLLAFLRIVWGLWARAPARRFTLELLDSGLIAFVLVFLLIRPFVVQSFYIPSESMVPSLMPNDHILVSKFIYRVSPMRRGDIVVFDAPDQALHGDGRKDFVKRLIGLPGDSIQIRRGEGVYINGRRLEEPPDIPVPNYDWPVDEFGMPTDSARRVPEGYCFVLGDNRQSSNDSHKWGPLEERRVLGKAMAIFWPPMRIGVVGDNREVRLREGVEVVRGEAAPLGAAAR